MNITELWRKIKQEVEVLSHNEPTLGDFFQACVFDHATFSEALGFTLADQLGDTLVSVDQLAQLFNDQMQVHPEILQQSVGDLLACFDRDPACDQYVMPLLYFKGYRALQTYRLGHSLWQDGRHSIALYLQGRVSELFGVDIHPAASIGTGILVDHATGLVIGETAVVDDDVSILHSVTLGGTGSDVGDRHPKIKRGVLIAVGAKVLGNIVVGEGAKIAAGSLVLEDVAPHTTVAGVPAKLVGRPSEDEPAFNMEQQLSNEYGI